MSSEEKSEYIVEFQQHGTSVKVSVIDPKTMLEVSIVGPSSVGQEELKRTALAKLQYVMSKKNGRPAEQRTTSNDLPKKPGIVV
ncbi:DUF6898 family protein [Sneathiella litorea]|uniref:DUF6898 domain-containing protein n=1 Tax=Sneathiella litorea TaxID=2606216 RepID=A0A6L8W9B1_9PROT|nr:hypothetical protein [Sneathiella litorea]MZR31052.1 hypothetical protein [Sneathiella litorea]